MLARHLTTHLNPHPCPCLSLSFSSPCLQDGQATGPKSLYLTPRVAPPSAPTNVTVTVVSNRQPTHPFIKTIFTYFLPLDTH